LRHQLGNVVSITHDEGAVPSAALAQSNARQIYEVNTLLNAASMIHRIGKS
jgi:hypothetical protein